MLPSIAAAVLLGLAAPALAAPFDRVNDDECVAGNDEVDFASLAKGLNDSGACTGGDQCEFKVCTPANSARSICHAHALPPRRPCSLRGPLGQCPRNSATDA